MAPNESKDPAAQIEAGNSWYLDDQFASQLDVAGPRAAIENRWRIYESIVDEWLNWDNLEPVVASYRKLIEKEVEKDVRKESSFEDFANGDVSTVKGGRVLGLKQFVEKFLKTFCFC